MNSGNVTPVSVGLFDELVCRGAGTVHVVSGAEPSVGLLGRSDQLDLVRIRNRNMRLVVSFRVGANPWRVPDGDDVIGVQVVADSLSRIHVQGFSTVILGTQNHPLVLDEATLIHGGSGILSGTVSATRVKIRNRSNGQVRIAGDARWLDVANRGMGVLDCSELVAQRASAISSGLGRIELLVLDELSARMDGMGAIGYRGEPIVHRRGGGLGRLEKLD